MSLREVTLLWICYKWELTDIFKVSSGRVLIFILNI